ncbi:MAG: 50S ribosomal protein L11 methyltransferase [Chitinophagaceae bacterium]|nr:50S ribosomal protein L11 methyltransferase [Chitinophagaceae bacterium]
MKEEQFVEIIIPAGDDLRELLVAQLDALGYQGYEESETDLKAYISEAAFDEQDLNKLLQQHQLSHSRSIIKQQNWNRIWESNFEPVQVEDFVGIRADFHEPIAGVKHEIVITPKMSFGTGHHATTWLVMRMMQDIDFRDRSVFDFGTGTGILAILAEKLGAAYVLAVDNDEWCIENASENISINSCETIEIQKVDTAETGRIFDITIANVNRHIILDNLGYLSASLPPEGILVLSGLLTDDEKDISAASIRADFQHLKTVQRNGWIAMLFCKKS